MKSLLERWSEDDLQFQIRFAWEVLPSMSGMPHLVDPDPDAQFENFPVSLCGTALVAKNGKIESGHSVCETCLEISRERQAEFDSRVQDGEF